MASPVPLSNAPRWPAFSQDITYFLTLGGFHLTPQLPSRTPTEGLVEIAGGWTPGNSNTGAGRFSDFAQTYDLIVLGCNKLELSWPIWRRFTHRGSNVAYYVNWVLATIEYWYWQRPEIWSIRSFEPTSAGEHSSCEVYYVETTVQREQWAVADSDSE